MKDLGYYWDLVVTLTKKEIKVRYKGSYFGYLWSILNPLTFALIFYFLFGIVYRIKMENYALFLVTGLFPWQWLNNSIIGATTIYISNASLIKKVNFPRSVLPLAIVLQDLFHFLCAIPVIICFLFLYHKSPSILWIPGIPLLAIIQVFFVYGIALLVSAATLFFRDLEQITSILLMFAFYPTPILYPVSMVPDKFKYLIVFANPLAPIILSWKNLFMNGVLTPAYVLAALIYGLASITFGCWIHRILRWRFAEVL